jgi:hypothetical protein
MPSLELEDRLHAPKAESDLAELAVERTVDFRKVP